MSKELKQYHRELALYVLGRARGRPLAADEVTECMLSLAQHEGLPKPCWAGINPQSVAGMLKSLQNAGLAEQLPDAARHARAGRAAPAWRLAPGQPNPPMPLPPDDEGLAGQPAKVEDPYEGLSRQQLITLLKVHEDLAETMGRFKVQMADFQQELERKAEDARMEQEIRKYKKRLADAGRVCNLDEGDIEWLEQH